MGIFDGIETAKSASGGSYIRPCMGVFQINDVKQNSGPKGTFVVVELTCVQCDGVQGQDAPHSPGEDVSHVLNTAHMSWQGNFKNFVMAATTASENEVTSELCEQVLNGVVNGHFVSLSATNVTTKSGGDFTKVIYKDNVTEQFAESA